MWLLWGRLWSTSLPYIAALFAGLAWSRRRDLWFVIATVAVAVYSVSCPMARKFGRDYSRDAVALAAGFGPDDAVAFEMLEGLLGPAPAVTADDEESTYLVEG